MKLIIFDNDIPWFEAPFSLEKRKRSDRTENLKTPYQLMANLSPVSSREREPVSVTPKGGLISFVFFNRLMQTYFPSLSEFMSAKMAERDSLRRIAGQK